MPRYKSLTSLFIDLIVFVSMFALLGHLSMNFWERFILQKELTNMKTSLHSLKETIYKIGYAYDTLHRELTGLTQKSEQQKALPPIPPKREVGTPHSKNLDRTHYNKQVQVAIKAKNNTTNAKPILTNTTAQIFMKDNSNKTTQYFPPQKKKIGKSASTMTRYPLKSTGVGYEKEKYDTDYNQNYYKYSKSNNQIEKCCKDHGCYNQYENWKF